MELDELKSMWLSENEKLEKRVRLNEQQIELMQGQKIASTISPLFWKQAVICVLHGIVIVFLVVFLVQNISQVPFAVSGFLLLAFYVMLCADAWKQIRIIRGLDYNADLVTLQSSIVRLQTHIVGYARLAVLTIPALLAFPVVATKLIKDYSISMWSDFDIMRQSNGNWWTAQIIATAVLIPLGIWFYREISFKNIHKKWVNDFIRKSSGTRITKSLEFLNELQGLKQDAV